MKFMTDDALAALERGDAIVSGAVEILCDPEFRAWGGYGLIEIDGRTFTGIGNRGLVQQSGSALGGSAQGLQLSLSGVDPTVLDMVDADAARGAASALWRLIFDSSGTKLLDAQVFARGRLDELPMEDVPGGTATITAMIETAARALGRRGGRTRSDSDQRLIKSTDGGFKNTSFAGSKTLYWGGHGPTTAGGSGTAGSWGG